MKTINMTRMAMALVVLMALSLSGCAQNTTGGNMDTSMEGTMTEQKMDTTMDTMGQETMKKDMEEMGGMEMQDTMDTMKHDTMQDEMDATGDRMMQDSDKEMMP